MTIRPRVAIAAAALAAVALVGGCSSSSSDASSATTTTAASSGGTTTKAQFIAAANGICTNADSQFATDATGMNTGSAASALASMQTMTNTLASMVSAIKALPQPTGADAPTEVYSTAATLQSGLDGLVQAAQSNEQAKGNEIEAQLNGELAATNAAWNAYGLTACSSSMSSTSTTAAG
jgi:hypothetical protein